MFIFITGWYDTAANAKTLHNFIIAHWQSLVGQPIVCYRHDQGDEIVAYIRKNLKPNEKLCIGGFSYGGDTAVELAKRLGTAPALDINMILVDPVSKLSQNQNLNFVGFDLPPNVRRAWCVYRKPKKNYFSGPIRTASCEFLNKKFNPKPNADEAAEHGQYVWGEPETWQIARTFLT